MSRETPEQQLRRVVAEGKRLHAPSGKLYRHLTGVTARIAYRPTQAKPTVGSVIWPHLKTEAK